jgi:hypothetical protein
MAAAHVAAIVRVNTDALKRRNDTMNTSNTKSAIVRALSAQAGAHIGDLVWPEISEIESNAYSRAAIGDDLDRAGLPRTLIADEIGPQGALGRARHDVEKSAPSGYRIETPRKRDRAFHVFRSELTGADARKVTCAIVTVDDITGGLVVQHTPNQDATSIAVCDEIAERFKFHMDFADHRDVHRMVALAMAFVGGTRLKRGALYFVPAAAAATVRNFAGVVEALGACELTALPIYDTQESRDQAARSLASSLDSEIGDVLAKVRALASSPRSTRESTFDNREAELAEIALRIESVDLILDNRRHALNSALVDARTAIAQAKAAEATTTKAPRASRKASTETTEAPAADGTASDLDAITF